MPLDKATFRFPDEAGAGNDPDADFDTRSDLESVEQTDETTINPVQAGADTSQIEVEVIDDTPEQDRGREPMAEPPKEFADDELQKYDEGVQRRIRRFTKGYHDERRRAEAAERQREAAVQAATALSARSKQLEESLARSQEALLAQAKRVVQSELDKAREQFRSAHESGDADAVLKAQEALHAAQLRVEKVNSFKPQALAAGVPANSGTDAVAQAPAVGVQPRAQAQVAPATSAPPDTKALAWQERNSWFGTDRRMTAYALALHSELVDQGVNPQSDDYYSKVDAEMRRTFPAVFKPQAKPESEAPSSTRRTSVVAPATRSAPGVQRITLTKSQLEIAKRLNVTPQQYALQVLALNRRA